MAKIFVVEDDSFVRKKFESFLGMIDDEHSAIYAKDGQEALEMMQGFTKENRPDVFLFDNKWPAGKTEKVDMNDEKYKKFMDHGEGLTLGKITTDGEIFPEIKDVPIIMWTSNKTQMIELLAKEVGIKRVVQSKDAGRILDEIIDVVQQNKGGRED